MTERQEQMLAVCVDNCTRLTPKESDFIEPILDYINTDELAPEQARQLEAIHQRFSNN